MNGTQQPTGYHKQLKELTDELINHGYGEIVVKISSLKDNRVRIQINCGKGYVFFVEKNFPSLRDRII